MNIAKQFTKYDRPRSEKVSGSLKRKAVRFNGLRMWDGPVWRLVTWHPHPRVFRGNPVRNPTALT